jgi:hypothetical protein
VNDPHRHRRLADRPTLRGLVLAALIVVLGVLVVGLALRDDVRRPPAPAEPVNPPASPLIAPPAPAEEPSGELLPASQLGAARRVARRFLDDYLAFLYGRAPAAAVGDTSAAVRRELARNTPRIPPAQRNRTPRVIDLAVTAQAPRAVIATATIDDGDVAVYPIVFTLDRQDGRWHVSRLASD